MNLSVVIPCYNEEEAIPVLLPKVFSALSGLTESGYIEKSEVIVVNDGSTDKSSLLLQNFKELITAQHIKNKGYGAALKTGIQTAKFEYVITIDLDDTYPPAFFKELIKEKKQKSNDFVVGVRTSDESSMPLIRKIGNFFFTQLTKLLYKNEIKDPCSGMWLLKRKTVVDNLSLFPNKLQFTLFLTLFLSQKKIAFSQVPITYLKREGISKLSPIKDGLMFLYIILKSKFI